MDYEKIRATGPWVFIHIQRPPKVNGLEMRNGLYLPNGNFEERTGLSRARVISVGPGKWNEKKGCYWHHGVTTGDVVVFRGFLEVVHKPHWLADDYCFIHIDDVLGFHELLVTPHAGPSMGCMVPKEHCPSCNKEY